MKLIHEAQSSTLWWKDAVIYQVYPRSFASSHGPIGDLPGITSRLEHLAKLGVDALWLSPFYASPQKDGGYDVTDYRQVDPMFGNNDDALALLQRAHELGLRVIVDLVPNHTSDQHIWFQAALSGGKDHPARELYWFRDGVGKNGAEPPNNWTSVFGGNAWQRVCERADAKGSPWENDGQWYLHLFDASQPDLNWENPRVAAEFEDILRYWLDLGVDGFRVDVAHGLVKDTELPNWDFHWEMVNGGSSIQDLNAAQEESSHLEAQLLAHPQPSEAAPQFAPPMWNRPEVHKIYRRWRKVLDEYGDDRILVAEAWVDDLSAMAKYVRRDEMSQSFNFPFLCAPFEAAAYHRIIAASLAAMDEVGAPTTWVLSNHDVVRATSRFGLSYTGKKANGIFPHDEQPDVALGKRRALAAHLLLSALPGSCYIYQGEELSLPEHTTMPDKFREDPTFFRTGGKEAGRDGQRVPMPWEANQEAFGFSPTGSSWLPQPAQWQEIAVDIQESDEHSSLSFFKRMYALRKELRFGQAALFDATEVFTTHDGAQEPLTGKESHSREESRSKRILPNEACSPNPVNTANTEDVSAGTIEHLHYVSRADGRDDVHILVAFDRELPLPEGAKVLLASGEIDERSGFVPKDTSLWYTLTN